MMLNITSQFFIHNFPVLMYVTRFNSSPCFVFYIGETGNRVRNRMTNHLRGLLFYFATQQNIANNFSLHSFF